MLCEIETAWPPPGPEEIHWKVPLSGEWVVKFVCLLFCCKAPRLSACPKCLWVYYIFGSFNECMSRLFTFYASYQRNGSFVVNIFCSFRRCVGWVVVPVKWKELCAIRGSDYTLPYFVVSGILDFRASSVGTSPVILEACYRDHHPDELSCAQSMFAAKVLLMHNVSRESIHYARTSRAFVGEEERTEHSRGISPAYALILFREGTSHPAQPPIYKFWSGASTSWLFWFSV